MKKVKLQNAQIPLHYQISNYIMMMLKKGEINPQDKLPTEEELREIFGVSRTTIRRALEHLLNKGFLFRKQGKGTFWTDTAYQIRKEKLSGINRQIFDLNEKTSVKVLSKSVKKGEPEILNLLRLEPGSEVIVFERLRFSNNEPMSFSINYLPLRYGEVIEMEYLKDNTMLETLEKIFKIELGTIEHQVEITRANQDIAIQLKIPVLDPVLTINTSVYDPQKEPIEVVWTYFVENKYKLRVVFDR